MRVQDSGYFQSAALLALTRGTSYREAFPRVGALQELCLSAEVGRLTRTWNRGEAGNGMGQTRGSVRDEAQKSHPGSFNARPSVVELIVLTISISSGIDLTFSAASSCSSAQPRDGKDGIHEAVWNINSIHPRSLLGLTWSSFTSPSLATS